MARKQSNKLTLASFIPENPLGICLFTGSYSESFKSVKDEKSGYNKASDERDGTYLDVLLMSSDSRLSKKPLSVRVKKVLSEKDLKELGEFTKVKFNGVTLGETKAGVWATAESVELCQEM
jgi:hypothetical protein